MEPTTNTFPGGPRDPLWWLFLSLVILHGAFLVAFLVAYIIAWISYLQ